MNSCTSPCSSLPPHPGLAEARQILEELTPVPKARQARSRKRKTETAAIVTSSPYKNQLEQKSAKRKSKGTHLVMDVERPAKKSIKKTYQEKVKLSVPAPTISSDTTPCCICAVRYCDPPFDDWQQCPKCSGWYHLSCGPEDTDICFMCLD